MPCNCERCGKEFPDKSKLKQHFLRKKICKLSVDGNDLTYEELWKMAFRDVNYNMELIKKNQKNQKAKNKKKSPKVFICNSCGKVLKHSSSYYRHINKNCEMKKKINKMEKEIKEQTELLCKLVAHGTNNGGGVVYNTTNNTQNIFNQNNFNISINNFGEEDLSHITENFLKDIIFHMGNTAVVKYIQEVHFNNPCNTNIKMLDDKAKVMMIKRNNEWILDNKNLVLDGMINLNMDRIQRAYEELEDDITENLRKEFEDYSNDKKVEKIEDIRDGAENMILNNQKQLMPVYAQSKLNI